MIDSKLQVKLKHWCGSWAIFASIASPVLGFGLHTQSPPPGLRRLRAAADSPRQKRLTFVDRNLFSKR